MTKRRGGFIWPTAATRADSAPYTPPPAGTYSINFAALGSNDVPISQGGVWTNNSQGTGGNAVMGTQTSMQVRLSADGLTRICCESDTPHINYEDSIGWVPGFQGKQRIVGTIYREAGYLPNVADANHEIEMYAGARCVAPDRKRCMQIAANCEGGWFLAIHDGWPNPYNESAGPPNPGGWIVVYSASVNQVNGAPLNGHQVVFEFDPDAKLARAWHQGVLRLSLDWNTTHDEITPYWQNVLNNMYDGAGLAGIRRPGATGKVGAFGWTAFSVSQTLLGGP